MPPSLSHHLEEGCQNGQLLYEGLQGHETAGKPILQVLPRDGRVGQEHVSLVAFEQLLTPAILQPKAAYVISGP